MLSRWLANYSASLRLICGLPVSRQHFTVSMPFILFALFLSIATFAIFDYFQQDGIIYQDVYGSALLGAFYFCGALLAIIITHLEDDYFQLPTLLTIVLCTLFWFAILLSLTPFEWAMNRQFTWLPLLVLIAVMFITVRTISLSFFYAKKSSRIIAAVFVAVISIHSWQNLYLPNVFSSYQIDQYDEQEPIDIEHVFYQQQRLLETKLALIEQNTPDQRDYYFVGFGSSDRQTVFESEAKFAEQAMRQHFATNDRSVILFNDANQLAQEPIANKYNLRRTLVDVGSKIDPEEDVLILLLTSHGSTDAELAVELESFPLQDIDATEVRSYLDESQIKWRVIIVSACYAGSFIKELANDYTLLITAAAQDRNSFGCSSERQLTVFGEAFFKESFANEGEFIRSFERAYAMIKQWESDAELIFSDPQIVVGKQIRTYLQLPNLAHSHLPSHPLLPNGTRLPSNTCLLNSLARHRYGNSHE